MNAPRCRDCQTTMVMKFMQDEDLVLHGSDVGIEAWTEFWECPVCGLKLEFFKKHVWSKKEVPVGQESVVES
jgi:hypothetical protein